MWIGVASMKIIMSIFWGFLKTLTYKNEIYKWDWLEIRYMKFQDPEDSRSWRSKTMKIQDHEDPRPWRSKIMKIQDHEDPRSWRSNIIITLVSDEKNHIWYILNIFHGHITTHLKPVLCHLQYFYGLKEHFHEISPLFHVTFLVLVYVWPSMSVPELLYRSLRNQKQIFKDLGNIQYIILRQSNQRKLQSRIRITIYNVHTCKSHKRQSKEQSQRISSKSHKRQSKELFQ